MVKRRNVRFLKKTFKFGIEVTNSVREAYALDKKNGDTKWADAICKEMENICLAFWIGADGETIPIGYQKIRCHLIFDIKQDDLSCKACLVAGGHTTEAPATITYASVVSRETV